MDRIDFPVFDGDPDDYDGVEVIEHTWPDARVDTLPAHCPDHDTPADRVEGPGIARAVLQNMHGTWGVGGAGLTGSTLYQLGPDLFAEVGEDETYPEDAPAWITRGPLAEVVDAWLAGLPTNEFTPGLGWADVALAHLDGLAGLADPFLLDGALPVCLFPGVDLDEAAADWFAELTLDLPPDRDRELLRARWAKAHPWAARVAAGASRERGEFNGRIAWLGAHHGWAHALVSRSWRGLSGMTGGAGTDQLVAGPDSRLYHLGTGDSPAALYGPEDAGPAGPDLTTTIADWLTTINATLAAALALEPLDATTTLGPRARQQWARLISSHPDQVDLTLAPRDLHALRARLNQNPTYSRAAAGLHDPRGPHGKHLLDTLSQAPQ